MSDEPTLPCLPAVREPEPGVRNPRKRAVPLPDLPSLLSNSSDPAVFSSDDVEDVSVDNYASASLRRRKRRYVGSWFHQQAASSPGSSFGGGLPTPLIRKPRKFQRHLDSGVWMGSDETDSDDLSPPCPPAAVPQFVQPAVPRPTVPRVVVSEAEQKAREEIQRCIATASERVDLMGLELASISSATIWPLLEFECPPAVDEDVPFTTRDPELHIFLSSNRLTKLPGAMFDMQFLICLSLRNNRLRHLPVSIAKLRNLTTLNVSQNSLSYLPGELLSLFEPEGKLATLFVYPNPFHQPNQDLPRPPMPPMPEWKPRKSGLVAQYLCRTPVQYSDMKGRVSSKFRLPTGPEPETIEIEPEDASTDLALLLQNASRPSYPASGAISKVPSLMEAILRSCTRSPALPELVAAIPDGSFGHIRQLLERAADQQEHGGLVCCRCGKAMVTPMTRWYEWVRPLRCEWSLGPQDNEAVVMTPLNPAIAETALPFLRQGCTWKCLPTKREYGELIGFGPSTPPVEAS